MVVGILYILRANSLKMFMTVITLIIHIVKPIYALILYL